MSKSPQPPLRRSRAWWAIPLLAFVGLAVAWQLGLLSSKPRKKFPDGSGETIASDRPLPEFRATRFRNTGPEATFVGNDACTRCHFDEHESYKKTPHSEALGVMNAKDLEREPPDGKFVHARTNAEYRVERDGDAVLHTQSVRDVSGSPLVEATHAISHHIGSGNHSRSYLISVDGFLTESPITWYASKKQWGVSPGYDQPTFLGFERRVDLGCLVCHAGRVESIERSRYRLQIHEGTIGCESCHGPGSIHVAHWGDRQQGDGSEDRTIVNPARLTREVRESICAQCHLRGAATVVVRGRSLTDFRPGMPLDDVRVDYLPDQPDIHMKVVGHVEQMGLSACYQNTESLTCTTCHNPHARPEPAERMAHFRAKCVSCHQENCRLDATARRQKSPEDDCVACHMPQNPTDIPHFAFTHHRIGIHRETPPPSEEVGFLGKLVAQSSLDHLSEGDQQRCLGLAYLEYSDKQPTFELAQAYQRKARQALEAAVRLGVHDADTLASLARLALDREDFRTAVELAERALAQPPTESGAHENAFAVIGHTHHQRGELAAALPIFERLTKMRRAAGDWRIIAECRLGTDPQAALAALREAEKINPFSVGIHAELAMVLAKTGHGSQAAEHNQTAERMNELLQSIRRKPSR